MEIQKPKVSVIIPVFRPGEGITKCIKSVLGQSLKDIEIIFIDDCGNDDAMEKVREAAAKDDRIIILTNTENSGSGFSRNRGIEVSHGEYLSFIDPDDIINDSFLEALYKKAIIENLDIVKGKRLLLSADNLLISSNYNLNTIIEDGLQQGAPLYVLFTFEHQSAIYRRQMVLESDVKYGLARKAQDTVFLLRATLAAATFGTAENACYYYCKREGSAVHRKDFSILEGSFQSTIDIFNILKKKCLTDLYALQYTYNIIERFLRHHNFISEAVREKELTNNLLQKVRHEVLALPFIDDLIDRYIEIRALVEYGENLSQTPYTFPGEEPLPEQQLEILNRWCSFFITHPNLDEQYKNGLENVFDNTRKIFGIQAQNQTFQQAMNLKNKQQEVIYASESWKIGNAMVQPLHFVKSILSKIFARNHL